MKQISLNSFTFNKVLVDDEDYIWLNNFSWTMVKTTKRFYAKTKINNENIYMHNLILPSSDPNLTPDHIDLNGLNNQRSNLRLATRSQQQINKGIYKNNSSGFKGVYFNKKDGKFMARVAKGGVRKYIGSYNTATEAAIAYNEAAFAMFGDFAQLNIL